MCEEQAYFYNLLPEQFYEFDMNEFLLFCKSQKKKNEFEQEQSYYQTGLLCATIANFSMNKRKGKSYKVSDFVKLSSEKKRKRLDANQIANQLKAMTVKYGGEVKN